MHIPQINLAASMAGVTAKPVVDKQSEIAGVELHDQAHVEQSSDSNPDRDAQGQGDGIGDRRRSRSPKGNLPSQSESNSPRPAPNLPDEPPSELDLVG